jgi:hypothetical protein
VAQAAQHPIDRVIPMQEIQQRSAPHSNPFQGTPDAEITPRGNHPFFECFNRVGSSAGLVVHFRQIQVELRVVAFQVERFAAERFRIAETAIGHRCQQAGIGKVKRVFGSRA